MRTFFYRTTSGGTSLFAALRRSPSRGYAMLHTTRGRLSRLSVVRPDISSEWVVERNDDVDVSKVECSSDYSAWWRCSVCREEWQATVRDRAIVERGCPSCQKRHGRAGPLKDHATAAQDENLGRRSGGSGIIEDAVSRSPSLESAHPHLALRWHPTLNGSLTPADVAADSVTLVWWTPESSPPQGVEERSVSPSRPPFQREVCRFVLDPRSPEQQNADQVALEESMLASVAKIIGAPSGVIGNLVTSMSPRHAAPHGADLRVQADLDAAVLSYLKKQHPRSLQPAAISAQPQPEYFPKQPMRNLDEALREKTMSFLLHKFLKGKGLHDNKYTPPHELEALVAKHLGSCPSYISDEPTAWAKFFRLEPNELERAWKGGSEVPVPTSTIEDPHTTAEESTKHERSSPNQQSTLVPSEPTTTVAKKSMVAGSGDAAAKRPPTESKSMENYPPKPKWVPHPKSDEAEAVTPQLTPCKQRRKSATSTPPSATQATTESVPRVALQVDTLLDDAEATALSGIPHRGTSATAARAVTTTDDLLDALGDVVVREPGYSAVAGDHTSSTTDMSRLSRRAAVASNRRKFNMHMPDEAFVSSSTRGETSSSTATTTPAVPSAPMPKAPRVVSKPRKNALSGTP